ncbi:hypothetical protein LG634_27865 [Streptomyces bambusae]|uniref:hypothetical protein n=1 Tax=Streptomyces bambusae TaxID=1550616 RepID=UPI001CFC4AB6|nr:hypothetical protein [Streptomyces bambusae]MCB5168624.1 hypothetical protein [Streptomyces bambusae]
MTSHANTLAFVESPVQLLNVLEWAYAHAARAGGAGPAAGPVLDCVPSQPAPGRRPGVEAPAPHPDADPDHPAVHRPARADYEDLLIVVLPPVDPMSRGQLRRMAALARDEGHQVRWQEARGGGAAPLKALAALTGTVRRARRIVVGDPFSRYVQLLLSMVRAEELVVVDDGTATMEFVSQLARGERLVRWHRVGAGLAGRTRELAYAPVSGAARRRFAPAPGRQVEVFSSMPVTAPEGVRLQVNEFAWTRAAFGPPRIARGTDLVGTSLVETGVVDEDRYLAGVGDLARTHGAARYFAHRRETGAKLRALAEATGLEIVRPDLPLELIARRGPVGRTIVSFPSTVVHTLPYALAGTGVTVAVVDIDPDWLTGKASPRARGFLEGVTDTARDVHRLRAVSAGVPTPAPAG